MSLVKFVARWFVVRCGSVGCVGRLVDELEDWLVGWFVCCVAAWLAG